MRVMVVIVFRVRVGEARRTRSVDSRRYLVDDGDRRTTGIRPNSPLPGRAEWRLRGDSVEEVGFCVIATAMAGSCGGVDEGLAVSRRRDRRRCGDQLGEFAEVLCGGGEVEFVASTIWAA